MAKVSAVVLIYDIRGFTAASKKIATADLGAFAAAAHRTILDLFTERPPTFVKNLGDGHLLIWETEQNPDRDLLQFVVQTAQKARLAFPAFVAGRIAEEGGPSKLPTRVGIGIVAGDVSKSDDYYGVTVNLAARLQNMARPEGLALDTATFESMAQKDASLAQVFRKDRVHLKGLGSTLVWIDRPFCWSRVWAKLWPSFASLVALLGYALLADALPKVPGASWIQNLLDENDLSVFRSFADPITVQRTASETRNQIARAIYSANLPDGRIATELRKPDDPTSSVWGSSQAICGLMATPELPLKEKRDLLTRYTDYLFGSSVFVPEYGWRGQEGEESQLTYAEPGLWTVAMLARALATPGLVAEPDRPRYLELLLKAQEAVDNPHYRPLNTGGWNIFPNQKNPAQYSPYTTALALHCLLEVHAAALPWKTDTQTRDALLRKTVEFLLNLYEFKGIWGWRRTHEDSVPVSEGLTLQVYAELLRAESALGVSLSPNLLNQIETHLDRLNGRTEENAYDAGEFRASCISHKGTAQNAGESINFAWHPWAIECASRWLNRKQTPSHAAEVRIRRSLSHLVVTLAPSKTREAVEGMSFLGGETLLGLSTLPPP